MSNFFYAASLLPALLVAGAAHGAGVCSKPPHVHHTIKVDQPAHCALAKLFEAAHFCLASDFGEELASTTIAVTPAAPATFNLVFDDEADFNLEYALTCTADDGNDAQSPKSIFTVGADGPAEPHVNIFDLYGAKGAWDANGDQVTLTVHFP